MKKIFVSILSFALALSMCAALCPGAFAADADAASAAPVAENLELKTYQNVSVGGSLSAYDPDGGALEYTITTEPVKGTIELAEDGSFVYTPRENKKGRDYFGYKAADADGNLSQEATVIIKIEKAKKDVLYSDMRGRADEYSAVLLSERGIFTGEKIGSGYVFSPQTTVSRGEFLSMCMELTGQEILQGAETTGFSDDSAIPQWQKPYLATALMHGTVSGYPNEEGTAFAANAPITCTEAAVMLNRMLNLTDVSAPNVSAEMQVLAGQAVANLSACRILPRGFVPSAALTRVQAAQMLSAGLALLESH